ncbi:ribosomal L1 domain-containing protein CG13096 [Diachasmimorpha longicaudata]|uniref:ribosomal L1 domain-containing protein CG13096 n=1 Tax=Diachasmimorpha longicaudata TaxID=58733 RepID=UPI0030B8CCC7
MKESPPTGIKKQKIKVKKPVGETKDAVTIDKNIVTAKKSDASMKLIKKVTKTNQKKVDAKSKIKNATKTKNLENEQIVSINSDMKNKKLKDAKKTKKADVKSVLTQKSIGKASNQEKTLDVPLKVARAPASKVKLEKPSQSSKPAKRRAATDESALPAKKKSKTSFKVKKVDKPKTQKSEPEEDEKSKTSETSVVTDSGVGKIGNLELTEAHVEKCVQTVLQLAKKSKEGKKSLLPEEENAIFLQVNCIKIPKTPRRQLRVFLPHMMVGPTDDVALFVPDLEKGRRKDYEKTIDHWETILRNKNVSQIKEVIPMNKVKTEYSQYEMKLKLGRLFDFFLVDGRITGHMTHLLGKTFRRSARPPTPVKLQRDNLKSEIDNALRKTNMEIHGAGNCHTMQVASVSMSEQQIVENIIAAFKALEKEYPGGLGNIRSILLKSAKTLALPVYYSTKNKNKVPVPNIAAKRPKAFKTVEGELSTTLKNVVVQVHPGGKVTSKKMKKEKK